MRDGNTPIIMSSMYPAGICLTASIKSSIRILRVQGNAMRLREFGCTEKKTKKNFFIRIKSRRLTVLTSKTRNDLTVLIV